MMICKADFEELFPSLAEPARRNMSGRTPIPPSKECLERWEDDGGLTHHKPPRRMAPVTRPLWDGYGRAAPTQAGVALATLPPAAAYGTVWAMLATYGQMLQDWKRSV